MPLHAILSPINISNKFKIYENSQSKLIGQELQSFFYDEIHNLSEVWCKKGWNNPDVFAFWYEFILKNLFYELFIGNFRSKLICIKYFKYIYYDWSDDRICIYIYIYTERGREGKGEGGCGFMVVYIYIYTKWEREREREGGIEHGLRVTLVRSCHTTSSNEFVSTHRHLKYPVNFSLR